MAKRKHYTAQFKTSRGFRVAHSPKRGDASKFHNWNPLLRLCYCCGISLYDLFTLQSGKLNLGKLKMRSLPDIPNPTGNRRHRIPFNAIHIRQNLEFVLTQEEQPPHLCAPLQSV